MKYLSIKDSVNYTLKSESTIRRLVKDVQNSVKNNQELSKKIKIDHTKKGSQKILINIDFLDEYYGLKEQEGSQMGSQKDSNDHLNISKEQEFIEFLKVQINQKDEQINALTNQLKDLSNQITSLIERQKESNILLLESKSIRQLEQDTRKKSWWPFKSKNH